MSQIMARLKAYDRRAVGLVGIVVVAAIVLAIGGYGALGVGRSDYEAELANSGGARAGDEVRVAGIGVGQITGLELEGNKVIMSFEVDDQVPVGDRTRLAVKLATLLGGRYVELQPAGNGSPPDDRIPLAQTIVPFDLPQTFEAAGPALDDLDGPKLREAMTTLADSMRGNRSSVTRTLSGLSGLSDVITKRRTQLGRLIDSAGSITTMVNDNSAELFTLMGQADSLIRTVLQRRELIRSVLTQVRTLTTQLRDTLAENRPQLKPLMHHLAGVSAILKRTDAALDRTLELFPPAARQLTNATGNGPHVDVHAPYSFAPDNLLCAAGAVEGCR